MMMRTGDTGRPVKRSAPPSELSGNVTKRPSAGDWVMDNDDEDMEQESAMVESQDETALGRSSSSADNHMQADNEHRGGGAALVTVPPTQQAARFTQGAPWQQRPTTPYSYDHRAQWVLDVLDKLNAALADPTLFTNPLVPPPPFEATTAAGGGSSPQNTLDALMDALRLDTCVDVKFSSGMSSLRRQVYDIINALRELVIATHAERLDGKAQELAQKLVDIVEGCMPWGLDVRGLLKGAETTIRDDQSVLGVIAREVARRAAQKASLLARGGGQARAASGGDGPSPGAEGGGAGGSSTQNKCERDFLDLVKLGSGLLRTFQETVSRPRDELHTFKQQHAPHVLQTINKVQQDVTAARDQKQRLHADARTAVRTMGQLEKEVCDHVKSPEHMRSLGALETRTAEQELVGALMRFLATPRGRDLVHRHEDLSETTFNAMHALAKATAEEHLQQSVVGFARSLTAASEQWVSSACERMDRLLDEGKVATTSGLQSLVEELAIALEAAVTEVTHQMSMLEQLIKSASEAAISTAHMQGLDAYSGDCEFVEAKRKQHQLLMLKRSEFVTRHLAGFWDETSRAFHDPAERAKLSAAFESRVGPSTKQLLAAAATQAQQDTKMDTAPGAAASATPGAGAMVASSPGAGIDSKQGTPERCVIS